VEKLRRRGMQYGIGDRITYVMVKRDRKRLAYEKSEDPLYVLENSLPIDKEYYIEQLSKPVHRLFEPIMDNVSSLFHGEHTQLITQSVAVNGQMNMFVKTVEVCVGCRKPGKILCVECLKSFTQHYISLQAAFTEKTAQYNECWVECQRCQGSIVNEVLCINRIFPNWYKRIKLKKEISPLQTKLEKLRSLSW
jgi:DNA polymerase delta subunit 1